MTTGAEQKVELQGLEDEVEVPYVIEDAVLMSPGTWNGIKWTAAEIKDAFERTDWDDQDVRALFSDHEDEESRNWIGEVRNVRMDGDDLIGDLHIVDKQEAMKLKFGAKFGISPKIFGDNDGRTMREFRYENFSLVFEPAVKTTFLNNATVDEVLEVLEPDDAEAFYEELSDRLDTGDDTMADDTQDEARVEEEVENQEAPEEEVEEVENEEQTEDTTSDDAPEAEAEMEEADSEVSDFQSYVQEMKEKHPDMGYQEIAEKWEELNKSPEERVEEVKQEFKSEVESLKDQISELSQQLEDRDGQEAERLTRRQGSQTADVEELSDKELDKKMMAGMLKRQGSSHLIN